MSERELIGVMAAIVYRRSADNGHTEAEDDAIWTAEAILDRIDGTECYQAENRFNEAMKRVEESNARKAARAAREAKKLP